MSSPQPEIRTLGTVGAVRAGHEVSLGGPQPRLLLAFLVYARGRQVTRQELVDALWSTGPPARPEIALRALLSKLRSALGIALLDGRLPARVSIHQEATVDMAQFAAGVVAVEADLARGAPDRAIEQAREVLALDRGAFGTGLDAEWLEDARREQRELRERALEAAAEAALAVDGAELRRFGLTAATELCQEQPYRERPHLLMMRLLALQGKRIRALSVYDALRERLRDELGLVPSPELRALHRQLLGDDEPAEMSEVRPPLPFPVPLAQSLRTGRAIGRSEPLTVIERHYDAAGQSGRLLLVLGEAGIGKTTVVADAAASAHQTGASVLYGRCDPEPLAPFGPFVEALAPAATAGALGGLPGPTRSYLSLLFPEVSPDPTARPEDPAGGALAQIRLFDAITAALVSLRAGDRAVMLVLDDLHWADPSTLLLLRYLAARAQRLPLLIVGTLRDPDPDRGERLPATLAILRRRSPLNTIRLHGLDEDAVGAVVSAWAETSSPRGFASELTAHTRGNPFYLVAVLDHLRKTRAIEAGVLPERLPDRVLQTAPESVREAVAVWTRNLATPERDVLDAAAVLGSQFSADEAAAIAGVNDEEALRALEAATDAGLTHRVDARTYGFRHALIRAALLDAISPPRRSFLHMRAAQVIEREGAGAERVAELALHFGRVLTDEVAPQVLRYARGAGEQADARYAFAEAAAHYELALRALSATTEPSSAERYELLMALGFARYRSVGVQPAAAPFAEAMQIAEAESDAERMALAALGAGLERYLGTAGGADVATVNALERADTALGGVATRLKARVKIQLLLERTFLDPLSVRHANTEELTLLVGQLDDPVSRLEAFVAEAVSLWHPSQTERLLDRLPEMLALAGRLERPDLVLHLNCTAFGWALELGRRRELDRRLGAASEAAEELRTPIHRIRVKALETTRLLLDGKLEVARIAIADLLSEARELFPEVVAQVDLIWSFVLARESGDPEKLLAQLGPALAGFPANPGLRAMAAEAALLAGDDQAARKHLARLSAEDFDDIHEDFLTLGVLSMAGSVAAGVGDRDLAARLHARLLPWPDRNVIVGLAAFHRPVGLTLGALEHLLGDLDSALARLQDAEIRARAMRAAPWEAEALYEQGRVFTTMRRQPDAQRAFKEAREIALAYGGQRLVRRSDDALQRTGASRVDRPAAGHR